MDQPTIRRDQTSTTTAGGTRIMVVKTVRTKTSMVHYKNSAFKHGYTRRDIESVLDNPLAVWELRGRDGHPVVSKIGFAANMDVIEVFYQYDQRGDIIVFHADVHRRR